MKQTDGSPRELKKAAVLVAGSWGTALAAVLAANGHEVVMWTRSASQAAEIRDSHANTKYLPGAALPDNLTATTDMAEALKDARLVLFAAPSSAMRQVASAAAPLLDPDAVIVHAAKGFEIDSLERMSHVLAEELGRPLETIVVLSGPSHAEEVVKQLPTTVVVASEAEGYAEQAQDAFINSCFRVYTNRDVIGVEVAGAIKNIIALGAGLSDGLGFGDNAKAALLTRGLAEIGRLGQAMGANMMTFAGLAGVGDLVATCTSPHSRNWRAGSLLASGLSLDEVLAKVGMVVEGVRTTRSARSLAARYGVEMPITDQLYEVLFQNKAPREAVESLMLRDRTGEL
ncbi:NAD(P)H-dependent glycerol-3-phosphate dehydrogenase [Paenibacillus pasadenensis]|uniref:Glycerol-3-phosphate dehydrogenase [NAD(P)+] n=1 Tax=Paenibacillus pasadenensis TaxID=217090 RepID=A0A2N5N5J8_9BACL|nr:MULTISPECIES: NAD(P)H-dependent glycerol-3-phosphate dehydrogenase [Paenibacillus]PLT45634.1 Glycerol-3-phosphate dehydrogenase [NAD(P)+] [Paenibacillus pasadenensis]QGG56082.1 NAD(P)H-dependent glycerol-3-phosphate dehydrogenase [Paenibacillus sp. B01]